MNSGAKTAVVHSNVEGETEGRRTPRYWPILVLLPALLSDSLKSAGLVGLAGFDLTLFSTAFLVIVTMLVFFERRTYAVKRMLPFYVLVVVVLVSAVTSIPGSYTVVQTRDFLVTFIIVSCLPVLLKDFRDYRGLVIVWLIAGGLVPSLVLIIGGSEYGRASLGENTLGVAYLSAVGLVVGLAAAVERLVPTWVALPVMLLSGTALVTIASRGPLIASFVAAIFWFALRPRLDWRLLGMLGVAGVAIAVGVSQAQQEALDRLVLYDEARPYLWAKGIEIFAEHPLFGVGWARFPDEVALLAENPHNIWISLASELGVIGIMAGLLLLVVISYRVVSSRSVPEVRVLAAVAAVMLVRQQFGGDISSRIPWMAFVPLLLIPNINLSLPATTGFGRKSSGEKTSATG